MRIYYKHSTHFRRLALLLTHLFTGIVLVLWTTPVVRAAVLTGDAPGDFPAGNVVHDVPFPDVGIPAEIGDISGWDIKALYFDYDPHADTARFGLDFFRIAGDADDAEGPDAAGQPLLDKASQDNADLGGTESIAVLFDVDRDGMFDFMAGVPGGDPKQGPPLGCVKFDLDDCFGLFDVVEDESVQPAFRFAAKRPETVGLGPSPSPARPDFEFAVPQWSNLLAERGVVLERCGPFNIDVRVFAGSFIDDGIGEDFLPDGQGVVTLNFPAPVSALCSCEGDLADMTSALAQCQETSASLGADADGDGTPDTIDQCPGTAIAVVTDLLGCSHEQFCTQFPGRGRRNRRDCKAADWQNDEPRRAKDCRIRQGQCVPRL